MTRRTTLWIVVSATLVLAAACAWVVFNTHQSNAAFQDSAATITFITAAAVGIERTIEALWTVVGGVLGTYWPLNTISRQVQAMVDDLNNALKPFQDKTLMGLDELAKSGKLTPEELAAAQDEIQRMKTRFDALLKLTPDNQRMQLLAASASQNVTYLYQKYGQLLPQLRVAALTAGAAINGLQDFLATFKDNPGRRLISIYLGAVIGLVVAGIFGLDLFAAVLQSNAQSAATDPLLHLRVILTGLAIGLGSNPTHEIIRAVQEYKDARKGQNSAQPNLPPQAQETLVLKS
ncbi:MAG: hypothetical protein ACM3MF_08440 [Anaerolineae bacterium]